MATSNHLLFFIATFVVCVNSDNFDFEHKCTPKRCFGIEYKAIADKYYNGIFFTEREILRKDYLWKRSHRLRWGWGKPRRLYGTDYDYCCPTKLSHRNDSHLVNSDGVMRAIVHMVWLNPPRYQWFPHAECVGIGSCQGKCEIEKIMVNLLVLDLSGGPWPFKFDWFEVPGYCSCKSS